ncbi:Xanthine dehydrogenase [Blattamonas nauphoetae]|uniref:Xanthine dehydrogenase n=1 Tax=Blattamonas nauphoetae TaxID=2049346 RepID=A0ABQ9X0Q2_9EUKA|nr:Xanthine dehydrogenase [Blattamonas nauphoetae]
MDTCCITSPTAASSGSDLNGMTVSVAYRIPLSARGPYPTPTLAEGHPFAYFVFGGSVGEVEINTLNGNTKVIRVDAVYDCGKSLNPHLDVGQIKGAIVMGIGYYLLEEPFVGPDGKLNSIFSSKAVGEPPLILSGVHILLCWMLLMLPSMSTPKTPVHFSTAV